MSRIPFEIPELPIRKIDRLLGFNATVALTDGRTINGFGRCILPLPVDPENDDSECDDFLDFLLDNGESEFIKEADIKSFRI